MLLRDRIWDTAYHPVLQPCLTQNCCPPPCSGMLSPASTALRPPCWPSSASTEILSGGWIQPQCPGIPLCISTTSNKDRCKHGIFVTIPGQHKGVMPGQRNRWIDVLSMEVLQWHHKRCVTSVYFRGAATTGWRSPGSGHSTGPAPLWSTKVT